MAHTYTLLAARTSGSANPLTASIAIPAGITVLVVLIKTDAATDRAGGSPTYGSLTLNQRSTAQKGAASPEAGCEFWDYINPLAPGLLTPGSYTLSIPNSGSLTLRPTVVGFSAKGGGKSKFDAVAGTNNTSANPAPGALTPDTDGAALAGIAAGGWQTWGPSAQVGTAIANTDDGAHGGGEQYLLQSTRAAVDLGWTQATSEDWGAIAAAYSEILPTLFTHHQYPKSSGMSLSLGR